MEGCVIVIPGLYGFFDSDHSKVYGEWVGDDFFYLADLNYWGTLEAFLKTPDDFPMHANECELDNGKNPLKGTECYDTKRDLIEAAKKYLLSLNIEVSIHAIYYVISEALKNCNYVSAYYYIEAEMAINEEELSTAYL